MRWLKSPQGQERKRGRLPSAPEARQPRHSGTLKHCKHSSGLKPAGYRKNKLETTAHWGERTPKRDSPTSFLTSYKGRHQAGAAGGSVDFLPTHPSVFKNQNPVQQDYCTRQQETNFVHLKHEEREKAVRSALRFHGCNLNS